MLILNVACLRGMDNELIVKELGSIGFDHPDRNHFRMQSYLFTPPYNEYVIPKQIRKTNGWITQKLHKIRWNDGNVPYVKFYSIVQELSDSEEKIYAKGSEQTKFFSDLCGKQVIDLDTLKCPKAEDITVDVNVSCGSQLEKHENHCAMNKCYKYATWMLDHYSCCISSEDVQSDSDSDWM
jgi:hypothetical protein